MDQHEQCPAAVPGISISDDAAGSSCHPGASGVTVPLTLSEASSASWLSSALGAEVVHVVAGPVDDRVSTNVPLKVGFADGGSVDLWVKGYFTESGSVMRLAGVPEVNFYREIAADAGLRTVRCLYAEVDPVTSFNVLVTEDVGEGAVFPDGRAPCTPDQTAQSLEQLAALHAATWADSRCASATWLDSRMAHYTQRRGVADIASNFEGPIGAGIPASVRDGERLVAAYKDLATEVARADPWCVVHGDAHIRNIYFDPRGRPSFIDWQLVQRGPWYLDVGYHIASMLSIEDRRAHQDALVVEYLDHLEANGVARPGPTEVGRGLRRSFLHGFYLWAITLRVDPKATAALLTRLGTAVADHDALQEVWR
jgi:hypothetical protein